MAIKSYSLRIDAKLLDKLHVVATYEGRSANSQILVLIRACIAQFESKHGEIALPTKAGKTTPPPKGAPSLP